MGGSVSVESDAKQLQVSVGTLKAWQGDLLARIRLDEEGNYHLGRLPEVVEWLSRAETAIHEVDDLLRHGMLENARPIAGQVDVLERAWELLMKDHVRIFGLYGMGGVGKTVILNNMNNKKLYKVADQFDIVIVAPVQQGNPTLSIQRSIGWRLGFDRFDVEWKQNMETSKRADYIYNALENKRFVLVLDDLESKVDLTEIGIPSPTKENRCKVVFATRSKDVCRLMGADADMEVGCLSPDDAWEFFRKTVTTKNLNMHPDIPKLAEEIARRCRGLPLALDVVGGMMFTKSDVYGWTFAVQTLTSSEIEKMCVEKHGKEIERFSREL
ncbi:PREDICTED: probable disease resistance protein At5g63020 [Tarenaya hassleriana]|uniref:probable disease resistance protein At5g63020 n=1 Tax=Tarenaya hassleriana TaxID=28532 RepID=UPI00053CA59E|nr:PREDICTED: probable disease resistance protein At5g63020 [Tarenaya hassleriana]